MSGNSFGNKAEKTTTSIEMDIVYPVREGEPNEGLRYSLRSLSNLPHRNVYIAGYKPKWIDGIRHIPTKQNASDLDNVNQALIAACLQPDLSDDFILMNDDFFIMQPLMHIPNYYQSSLLERVELYLKLTPLQAYSLIKTGEELKKLGFHDLKSYELHLPMVFNKHKLLEVYDRVQLPLFTIRPRSLYGNYINLGGKRVPDVKTEKYVRGAFLSTDITSESGRLLQSQFRQRSEYEVPVGVPSTKRESSDHAERVGG